MAEAEASSSGGGSSPAAAASTGAASSVSMERPSEIILKIRSAKFCGASRVKPEVRSEVSKRRTVRSRAV